MCTGLAANECRDCGEGMRISGPQASGGCQPRGGALSATRSRTGRKRVSSLRCRLGTEAMAEVHFVRHQGAGLHTAVFTRVEIQAAAAYHRAGRMMKSRRSERKEANRGVGGTPSCGGQHGHCGGVLEPCPRSAPSCRVSSLRVAPEPRLRCSGAGREIRWEGTVRGGGGAL